VHSSSESPSLPVQSVANMATGRINYAFQRALAAD
jgi:hypothetical protein